jgi:hypothetical protein
MAIRTIVALALLTFAAGPAAAWEAKVFEGEPADAEDLDLLPHSAASSRQFYSEDYTFTFRLTGTVKMHLKVGMSNLLGGPGSAFADGYVRTRGKKHALQGAFMKGSWSSDSKRFKVKMPDLSMRGDRREIKLKFVADGAKVDATLRAVVPGFRPGTGKVILADQGYVSMVVWPKMQVTGTVQVGEVKYRLAGYCIFTHAASTVEPQHIPSTWFYFKSKDPDHPVLFQGFQLTEQFGGTRHGWALAVKGESYVLRTNSLNLEPANLKDTRGASLPWSLLLKDLDGTVLGAIKADKLGGVRDRLKKLPPLQAAIIRKFINPRRYLFRAEMELGLGNGESTRTAGEYKVETMR